jgi:hypothetical protein
MGLDIWSNSYRLRLVSISCDPAFTFSIDGHQMTIIEVDGVNHQPLVVDSIQIFAGTKDPETDLDGIDSCENRTTVLGCGKDLSLTNVLENKLIVTPDFS